MEREHCHNCNDNECRGVERTEPETVEAMRAALDNCVRLLGVASMAGESLYSAGVTVAARAVLARCKVTP